MEHYSAHPALASEQLQRIAPAQTHHRRQRTNSLSSAIAAAVSCGSGGFPRPSTPSKSKSSNKSAKTTKKLTAMAVLGSTATQFPVAGNVLTQKTLPDRTHFGDNYDDNNEEAVVRRNHVNFVNNYEIDDENNDNDNKTKDCVDSAPSTHPTHDGCSIASINEPDHLKHCFSCTATRQHFMHHNTDTTSDQHNTDMADDGCTSGLSSAISSLAPSTTCSPLSTPTRSQFHQLQQQQQHSCPQNSSAPHHHHHHPSHTSSATTIVGGCKNLRPCPSRYRQLLPIALCILSFAAVFSILIVYMDTTEIRHQQFRLNMSRDYNLCNVSQDDPQLISFLRDIHMRKYPMQSLKNRDATDISPGGSVVVSSGGTEQHLNFSAHHDELTPKMAHYVAGLVGGKMNGAVIQSLPGAFGHLMTAPWFTETLKWAGVIVEPEPRRYFTLRKQNVQRPHLQVLHACVSPNSYPKEVTLHNEESEVRINSLLDEAAWFYSRVKCFPLYTIMMACNRVEYDLLSLGVNGHNLEILQTLPFDKVKIEVISIHLAHNEDHEDNMLLHSIGVNIQKITKFLAEKSYKLQKRFGRNYFYQRINTSTSRTRKKDILLLKTP